MVEAEAMKIEVKVIKKNAPFTSLVKTKKKEESRYSQTAERLCRLQSFRHVAIKAITYEVCLKSNGIGSINVLFYLTSEFDNMSPLE